jgi:hypothetical protein
MLNVFWSLVYNLNKSFLRIEYISGLVPTVAGFGRLSETRMPLCNQCHFIAAMISTTGMPLRNKTDLRFAPEMNQRAGKGTQHHPLYKIMRVFPKPF